jgi:hypothetical protein
MIGGMIPLFVVCGFHPVPKTEGIFYSIQQGNPESS